MQTQVEVLYEPLFLYVRKRVNNLEDAQDLTQDIFYKLSKSETSQVTSLKNWVYTIAKNSITDYYRKKKVLTEDVDDKEIAEEHNHQDAVEELSRCIKSYVAELPEEYKAIMVLSELEEIPQKEIAEKLDLKYSTVRSKVQRGRTRLREMFSECCTIKQGGKGSIIEFKSREECSNNSACS